jgi:hypothetical protein
MCEGRFVWISTALHAFLAAWVACAIADSPPLTLV